MIRRLRARSASLRFAEPSRFEPWTRSNKHRKGPHEGAFFHEWLGDQDYSALCASPFGPAPHTALFGSATPHRRTLQVLILKSSSHS